MSSYILCLLYTKRLFPAYIIYRSFSIGHHSKAIQPRLFGYHNLDRFTKVGMKAPDHSQHARGTNTTLYDITFRRDLCGPE